jgi:hypothetical protein
LPIPSLCSSCPFKRPVTGRSCRAHRRGARIALAQRRRSPSRLRWARLREAPARRSKAPVSKAVVPARRFRPAKRGALAAASFKDTWGEPQTFGYRDPTIPIVATAFALFRDRQDEPQGFGYRYSGGGWFESNPVCPDR